MDFSPDRCAGTGAMRFTHFEDGSVPRRGGNSVGRPPRERETAIAHPPAVLHAQAKTRRRAMAKGRMDLNGFVGQLRFEQDGDVLPDGFRVLAQALGDGVVGWGRWLASARELR